MSHFTDSMIYFSHTSISLKFGHALQSRLSYNENW